MQLTMPAKMVAPLHILFLCTFFFFFSASFASSALEADFRPYADEDIVGGGWGPAVKTRDQLLHDMNHVERLVHGLTLGKRNGPPAAEVNNTHEIFYPPGWTPGSPPAAPPAPVGPDEAAWAAKYLGAHPDVESRRFAERLHDGSTAFGHVFYITNPHLHFSVQPPEGGCDARSKVSATALQVGCRVASNAGFFNTRTGACLGNLISDGVVIQNTGRHNANFGLRKDGSFGVGYFGAEDVSRGNETDWAQLVAGVVWLVRDGRNYVAQSARLEDLSVQETGGSFVTVTSARHSIGHDRLGRLMLVLVNGKTGQRGVNLDSLANILVSLGAVNAINLDGGGSAQMVENGVVVNFPSDECSDNPRFTCERAISSIVCIRP